jgi:hypothetical protein
MELLWGSHDADWPMLATMHGPGEISRETRPSPKLILQETPHLGQIYLDHQVRMLLRPGFQLELMRRLQDAAQNRKSGVKNCHLCGLAVAMATAVGIPPPTDHH